ncbi:MAG: hypothetical protein KDA37_10260, partial [Planctomycetales bacterium]|nr:hypothetical protein [Planctomycetales bacterium]
MIEIAIRTTLFTAFLVAVSPVAPAIAAEEAPAPAPTSFVDLTLYPPVVELGFQGDSQEVVAVATRADGMTMDVTSLASCELSSVAGSDHAVRFADRRLQALGDGVAQLTVQFAGLSTHIDIHSKGEQPAPPVSYRHDVMPIFMRTGCNAGGCHGASRGKDGFRLSLFGFDPAGDHLRLTREAPMRRINLAFPEE